MGKRAEWQRSEGQPGLGDLCPAKSASRANGVDAPRSHLPAGSSGAGRRKAAGHRHPAHLTLTRHPLELHGPLSPALLGPGWGTCRHGASTGLPLLTGPGHRGGRGAGGGWRRAQRVDCPAVLTPRGVAWRAVSLRPSPIIALQAAFTSDVSQRPAVTSCGRGRAQQVCSLSEIAHGLHASDSALFGLEVQPPSESKFKMRGQPRPGGRRRRLGKLVVRSSDETESPRERSPLSGWVTGKCSAGRAAADGQRGGRGLVFP